MHCVQALLADGAVYQGDASQNLALRGCALPGGLVLVPVTPALTSALAERRPSPDPVPFPALPQVTGAVRVWMEALSVRGPVAYVETEYFGGDGEQAALVWLGGAVHLGPMNEPGAINQALRALGVSVAPGCIDEFDSVGLGRHRSTDTWLAHSAPLRVE